MVELAQTIKYNSERDVNFANEITSKPGCEDLNACIQCGTCSGVCPLSIYMDFTPRRIMHLTRSGFKDDVLGSKTIWLCSSCYSCTVECPKQIKITEIMYALKRTAIEQKVYPKKFPIPVLAQEFFKMVRSKGRTNESRLVMSMFLRTSWFELFKMWRLGLKLLRGGRFSLRQESVRNPKEMENLLN